MSALPGVWRRRRGLGIALVAAAGVGQAVAAGFAAVATRDVFAALYAAAPLPRRSLAVLAAAGVAVALWRAFGRVVAERVGQDYAAELRRAVFVHLTKMPAAELGQRSVGALALRFVGDLAAVRNWVSLGLAGLVSAAIVLPGALAALWILNHELALVAGAIYAAALLVMTWAAPRLRPLHATLRQRRARLAAHVSERILSAPELRLQGRDLAEVRRLDAEAVGVRSAAVRRASAAQGLRAVPEVATALAGAAFLALAFHRGLTGAEIAGALAVLAILAGPLKEAAGIWDRRRAFEVARDKCLKLLAQPTLKPALKPISKPVGTKRPGGEVDPAKGMVFKAAGAGALLEVSGRVAMGETVAVIGANGGGKSTLLTLAAGLAEPERGAVRVGGRDPLTLRRDERRRTICYVGPRSPLLRGTLRRALTMGLAPRPDDATIKRTARTFGLGPVLDRLGGLEGTIAEGGRNLSSGEARRLHLVRAALADPHVLLLDEPDDALDVEGREAVARLVAQSRAATLVVTHDLALARRCDRLWYVEGGRLATAGGPEELLAKDGPVLGFVAPRAVA